MNRKISMLKYMAVAGALAAGVSGIARADDSSMNPFTGDSYAYFNGGNLGDISKPVFDQAPSAWRESHPTGLRDIDFAALQSVNAAYRLHPPVLSDAPADASWHLAHPNGPTMNEFAAMGSEAIAARQAPNQSPTSTAASTIDSVVTSAN